MLSISITKHELPKLAFIVKLTKHFTGEKGNVKIMSLLKRHYTNWTTLYIFESFLNILTDFNRMYMYIFISYCNYCYTFSFYLILCLTLFTIWNNTSAIYFCFFVDSTLWTKISMISEWATYENLTNRTSGLLYRTNNRNCMHLIMWVY